MRNSKQIGPGTLLTLTLVFHLLRNTSGLQISGEWNTDSEFFHFLTKFGVQKTTPHERELTEGFIFGNITSRNDTEGEYGTLALLPRQFFVDYYRNRTKAAGDPDLACRLMFQGVSHEAYDAKCNDGGRQDFLRRVPCPPGRLCPDEDNPENIIPGAQLTYAIQDVNNPRFWYLSLVACKRDPPPSCQWRHVSKPLHLHYHLTIVNGNPTSPSNSPFHYHFSFDKQDTAEIFLVCLVYYGFILVPLQVYAACRQVHAITRLFTVTLVVQVAGLLFNTLHLLVFSSDGVGVQPINIVGDLLNVLAQSVFMLVLLVLAKGWAVTRLVLTSRPLILAIWGIYSTLILTLYFWNMMEVDVIEDVDQYQTWPGCVTLVLRVAIMVWFLCELRATMTYEHNATKLHFFLHFGAASLVWFIYLPVVALIALEVSPLFRYKLLLGFTYSADLLAHSFMTYLLWPERAEQYLLLAYEADLSAELDEFDEAPHVINNHYDAAQGITNGNYDFFSHIPGNNLATSKHTANSITNGHNLVTNVSLNHIGNNLVTNQSHTYIGNNLVASSSHNHVGNNIVSTKASHNHLGNNLVTNATHSHIGNNLATSKQNSVSNSHLDFFKDSANSQLVNGIVPNHQTANGFIPNNSLLGNNSPSSNNLLANIQPTNADSHTVTDLISTSNVVTNGHSIASTNHIGGSQFPTNSLASSCNSFPVSNHPLVSSTHGGITFPSTTQTLASNLHSGSNFPASGHSLASTTHSGSNFLSSGHSTSNLTNSPAVSNLLNHMSNSQYDSNPDTDPLTLNT